MLLTMHTGQPAARLATVSYDVSSARRARRVRSLLQSVMHGQQYSVFEVMQSQAQVRELIAELSSLCELGEDRLAVWWPFKGRRLQWAEGRFRGLTRDQLGDRPSSIDRVLSESANFMISYDVTDAARLVRVSSKVAAEGALVQRSVYWLRMPAQRMQALLENLAVELKQPDLLWVHPLQRADALWHVGAKTAAVLPLTLCQHQGRST